ncbi:hypothetical protein BC834DRAFT_965413 [Gloeopeniophorella convolvens]|nr:hypothetical protein BC834DRAFT_965413 [Gloeopeniophorella convolvens]
MADDTLKAKKKLSTLAKSLDDLESSLESLTSRSLPELILGLDTVQQAKLQVVIPYLVYDLVFVYLKTRGLDPRTHPVITELDRVRQYFDKIKDAEDPAKRQLVVDRAAAKRFIQHAISQAQAVPPPTGPVTHVRFDDDGTAHTVTAPTKVTAKMVEREQYFERLQGQGDEEEEEDEGLRVIDGDEGSDEAMDEDAPAPAASTSKGKGKARAVDAAATPEVASSTSGSKRRRPPVDPFAGYGDEADTRSPAAVNPTGEAPTIARTGTKARKIRLDDASVDASSGSSTPAGGEPQDGTKKAKKRPKKKARPVTG